MPACLEWGQDRQQECATTADQGYTACTATRDQGYRNCCTWAPCSWFCKVRVWVSNIVCVAWTWVSNVVCVAWTWLTTAVCLVWDIVTTIVNAILVTIESALGWVLSALTFFVELIEMVPGLGAAVRWVLNIGSHVANIVASLPDALLGLIGVRPEKILRVCTVILRDEQGASGSVADAVTLLQMAADVYKRDANVRIVPSRPFQSQAPLSTTSTFAFRGKGAACCVHQT